MLQRWRAAGNTVSDLTGPRFEPQSKRVTTRPTGRWDLNSNLLKFKNHDYQQTHEKKFFVFVRTLSSSPGKNGSSMIPIQLPPYTQTRKAFWKGPDRSKQVNGPDVLTWTKLAFECSNIVAELVNHFLANFSLDVAASFCFVMYFILALSMLQWKGSYSKYPICYNSKTRFLFTKFNLKACQQLWHDIKYELWLPPAFLSRKKFYAALSYCCSSSKIALHNALANLRVFVWPDWESSRGWPFQKQTPEVKGN